MKLRYMLTGSDEEFAQRVREAVERRARFEARMACPETFSGSSETSRETEGTVAPACHDSIDVVD